MRRWERKGEKIKVITNERTNERTQRTAFPQRSFSLMRKDQRYFDYKTGRALPSLPELFSSHQRNWIWVRNGTLYQSRDKWIDLIGWLLHICTLQKYCVLEDIFYYSLLILLFLVSLGKTSVLDSHDLFFQGEVEERRSDAAGQAGQDRDDAAGGQEEGRQRHTPHLARRRWVLIQVMKTLV